MRSIFSFRFSRLALFAVLIGCLFSNNAKAVYCIPSHPTCGTNSNITSVSIVGTTLSNLNSGCNALNGPAYSIFPATGNTTAALQQGTTYQLSVTTDFSCIVSLWIDYNQNQLFESSEWTQVVTASTANVPSLAYFNVPTTALTGTTGMRVRARLNGNMNSAGDACTTFGSGEAEDYTLTIGNLTPCTAPPVAGTTIATSTAVCIYDYVSFSLSGAATGAGLSYQWQYSSNAIAWNTITGATYATYFENIAASNYYRCALTCSGITTYSSTLHITLKPFNQCYCSSNAITSSSSDIGQVIFGNMSNGLATPLINNQTAYNTYTDYSWLTPVTVDAGAFYPIAISQVSSGIFENAQVLAYVDWDHSGSFDYPNEYYYLGQTTTNPGGNSVISGISVPSTATLGVTRMRIILTENGSISQPACVTYPFGETEDYSVNVVTPAPCSALPNGSASSSATSVCGTSNFTLNLIGGTTNSNATFYWEYSTDGINWTYLNGSSFQQIFTTSQSQSTYYRCVSTCNAFVATSSSIYVTSSALANCYCTSVPQSGTYSDIGNVTFGSLSNGLANPIVANINATGSYSDFTSLPAPNLEQNSSNQIWVSQITYSPSILTAYVVVYIDFNQDAFFDQNESFYLGLTNSNPGGNLLNGFIYIPQSALLGNTRMRVVLVESAYPNACGTYNFGETEDYTVNIVPYVACSGTPIGGTSLANATSVCANVPVILNLSGSSSGGGISYQWQYSFDSLNWINYTNAVTNTLAIYQSTSTYYRCFLNCNGVGAYSIPVLVNQSPISQCYCYSGATSSSDTDIGNITIGTLNNGINNPILNNASANKSFTDYTYLAPTNLELGGTYNISLSQITQGSSFFAAYAMAFIDFNQDGVFSLAEGSYLGGTFYPQQTTINSFILIDPSASLGITRMRIVLSENNAVSSGCESYFYGETEDYLINIVPASPCPVPLLGGIAQSTDSAVCNAGNFTLSLISNSSTPTIGYQWQASPNGTNWSSIAGANGNSFATFQTAASYYRCEVNCNGAFVYSGSVYVAMEAISQCYCSSNAVSSTAADIGNVRIASLNNGIAAPVTSNSSATKMYSDFTNLTPTALEIGTSHTLSVSQITSGTAIVGSYVYAYIDLNQDGFFSVNNENFYIGLTSTLAGGNVVSGNIFIPATANFGITRLRIVLNQSSNAPIPCGAYNFGETEDYLINIVPVQPCIANPIGGNAVASDTTVCAGSQAFISLQNNSSGANITYQWQFSPDNLSWQNLIGANFSSLTVLYSQPMYYRCVLACSTFVSNSSSVHLSAANATQCYCASSATNTADDDIGNVTFLTLNNGVAVPATSNATSVHLYSDFTSIAPQAVILGATYPISVSQINSGNFYQCQIVVYIDFNQNGLFESGVETISLGTTTNVSGGNTKTGTISIPFTAVSGLTRMRIVLIEGTFNTPSPCGTYTWGETEDYSLLVLQNQTCTSLPTAGNSNSSSIYVCPNSPFTLSISGNSSALGQYYQWQSSPNATTWSTISGISLDSSYIASQTSATYYRCSITCSGFTSYSTPVLVNMLQSPVCGYCTNIGGTSCPSNTKITNVTITGTTLNNSDTICYSINGSAVGVFPYGGNTTTTLKIGSTYFLSVTATQNVSKSAWLDFDQNGSFSSNEHIPICSTSVTGLQDVANVLIPWGSGVGPTGLRIRTRINGTPNGAGDACSFFGSGETEDYTVMIDLANSINNLNAKSQFSFYPNPVTAILRVNLAEHKSNDVTLTLLNVMGKKLMETNPETEEIEIDMQSFAKGIYFLQYKSANETLVKKVVKE